MLQLDHPNFSSYGPFLVKLVLFFVSLFLFTKLAGPLPFTVKNISSGVSDVFTISGEGRANIKPDIAVISLGVSANAKTVKEAQNQINQVINKVTQDLKELGIAQKDIKTENYNIYPNYKPQSISTPTSKTEIPVMPILPKATEITTIREPDQKISSYSASTNLSIKIRDTEKLNQIIDIATKDGANQIGGVSFNVDDRTQAENEARKKAIEDAKKKAQEAAKVAGFRLGKMVSYYENLTPPPVFGDVALERAEVMDTNIQPGSMEVVVSVTLNYEIR